jgi:hypothetical protein
VQIQEYSLESDFDEQEVDLREWTQNPKPVCCPWVKNETPSERYDFDVSKCDKIFDLFLQEKHIQMSPNHVSPPREDLKKISVASGTTRLRITPMNVGCSRSRFNRPLNNDVSSSIIRKC